MRFTTKTEYGVVCLVYMAKQAPGKVITIADLVKHEKMSITYLQKIFHALKQADIVTAHPGRNGGYSLARPASQITLKQVIEALEGGTFDIFCEPEIRKEIVCTHLTLCAVRPVWAKTKRLLDEYYQSVNLEMIVQEEERLRKMKEETASVMQALAEPLGEAS
ncbi:MAG: Rrf2 family transcriptional regulator [Candidatus Omnitrophica bacterium]|nr:Rrf2 family transcriptional regulator [Candidatus Omnitrophota bacterium]